MLNHTDGNLRNLYDGELPNKLKLVSSTTFPAGVAIGLAMLVLTSLFGVLDRANLHYGLGGMLMANVFLLIHTNPKGNQVLRHLKEHLKSRYPGEQDLNIL